MTRTLNDKLAQLPRERRERIEIRVGALIAKEMSLRKLRQPSSAPPRLVRMARVQALAEDVFEDSERANRCLREPLGELSSTAPLDWARTEAGARLVEGILAKIDWGAAA